MYVHISQHLVIHSIHFTVAADQDVDTFRMTCKHTPMAQLKHKEKCLLMYVYTHVHHMISYIHTYSVNFIYFVFLKLVSI